jgi:acetoin utilization protein AcuB
MSKQEESVKVCEFMTTSPVTANLKDGLRQTFYRMRERDIRHMPVTGDHEELEGIISDRDLRRPGWVDHEENVAHYYLLDNAHKVQESMTPDPMTVRPDDDIATAVSLIVDHRVGALPVVDEDRKLVGIISAIDMLRAFRDGSE